MTSTILKAHSTLWRSTSLRITDGEDLSSASSDGAVVLWIGCEIPKSATLEFLIELQHRIRSSRSTLETTEIRSPPPPACNPPKDFDWWCDDYGTTDVTNARHYMVCRIEKLVTSEWVISREDAVDHNTNALCCGIVVGKDSTRDLFPNCTLDVALCGGFDVDQLLHDEVVNALNLTGGTCTDRLIKKTGNLLDVTRRAIVAQRGCWTTCLPWETHNMVATDRDLHIRSPLVHLAQRTHVAYTLLVQWWQQQTQSNNQPHPSIPDMLAYYTKEHNDYPIERHLGELDSVDPLELRVSPEYIIFGELTRGYNWDLIGDASRIVDSWDDRVNIRQFGEMVSHDDTAVCIQQMPMMSIKQPSSERGSPSIQRKKIGKGELANGSKELYMLCTPTPNCVGDHQQSARWTCTSNHELADTIKTARMLYAKTTTADNGIRKRINNKGLGQSLKGNAEKQLLDCATLELLHRAESPVSPFALSVSRAITFLRMMTQDIVMSKSFAYRTRRPQRITPLPVTATNNQVAAYVPPPPLEHAPPPVSPPLTSLQCTAPPRKRQRTNNRPTILACRQQTQLLYECQQVHHSDEDAPAMMQMGEVEELDFADIVI